MRLPQFLACAAGLAGLAAVGWALRAQDASAPDAGKPPPEIILDESAGDWVVDRFAGNSTAGPLFLQGPAREAGGLGRPEAAVGPDGTVYVQAAEGLCEVTADGQLRLIVGGGGSRAEGTPDQVVAGKPAWNPKENVLYLTGPQCVRRLTQRGGRPFVEVVAGRPGVEGFGDGPALQATFTRPQTLVINGRGTIFLIDADARLRKIDNGAVSTLTSALHGGYADGPLAQARFNLIGLGSDLTLGEDDDTLYLADHWNFHARKIDLKAGAVSTVAGVGRLAKDDPRARFVPPQRYNTNADGPALDWAGFNSGCTYVRYDPVHRRLWCGGPDERRFRWLRPDGEVRTVIGAKGNWNSWPTDALGVPAEKVMLVWNKVVAVDARGRAYLAASSDPNGLWRAYNTKEARP